MGLLKAMGTRRCRVQTVDYGPIAESVPLARHWLPDQLTAWDLGQLEPDASLLVTELVTNAVIHAHSQVHMTATVADGVLEVAVDDHEPAVSMSYSHDSVLSNRLAGAGKSLAEGGRGMGLIDVISEAWGVARLGVGKQVWFRLSVDARWPHRTACPVTGKT